MVLYYAGRLISKVGHRAVNMAPRNVHGKLRFQIGFPLFVQTLVVGEFLGRVAPNIGLLSFVFMVFVLVKTLACHKVTSALGCNL